MYEMLRMKIWLKASDLNLVHGNKMICEMSLHFVHVWYLVAYTTHKMECWIISHSEFGDYLQRVRSCHGRVDKTLDFHDTGGPRFKPQPGSCAPEQGALSSLPSLSEISNFHNSLYYSLSDFHKTFTVMFVFHCSFNTNFTYNWHGLSL